jgi:anti-anti-sigma factor
MNNNAIPDTGGSVIASTLSYAMLCNPFLAADHEISLQEDAPTLPTFGTSGQVLRVMGFAEMTAAHCSLFRKTVCAGLDEQTEIEIDLCQTTSIDCAGLGALIAVRNLIRGRNGVVRLMNPTQPMQQLLGLMRAEQIFEIVDTRETQSAV